MSLTVDLLIAKTIGSKQLTSKD